jgi:hypothetical protein
VATMHSSIGNEQLALGHNAKAIFIYQKSLIGFKVLKVEIHALVTVVYVSLVDLYLKNNKPSETKFYCGNVFKNMASKALVIPLKILQSRVKGLFMCA